MELKRDQGVADLFGISVETLRLYLRKGTPKESSVDFSKIRHFKIGAQRRWLRCDCVAEALRLGIKIPPGF